MPTPKPVKGEDPKGVYQTIGYLFSAEDLMSEDILKAEQVVEQVVQSIQHHLENMLLKVEAITAETGASFQGVGDEIEGGVTPAVSGLANTLMDMGDSKLGGITEGLGGLDAEGMEEGLPAPDEKDTKTLEIMLELFALMSDEIEGVFGHMSFLQGITEDVGDVFFDVFDSVSSGVIGAGKKLGGFAGLVIDMGKRVLDFGGTLERYWGCGARPRRWRRTSAVCSRGSWAFLHLCSGCS